MDVLLFLWIFSVTVIYRGISYDLAGVGYSDLEDASNVCSVTNGDIDSRINIAQKIINITTTVGSSEYNCTTTQCNRTNLAFGVTVCRDFGTYKLTTVVIVGVCSFMGGVISVILVAVAYDRLRHRSCKVRCRKQGQTYSPEDSRSLQDSQVVEFHEDTDIGSYATLVKTEQRAKRLERKKKKKRNKETSVDKSRGMQPCTFMEPSQRNSAKIYELSVALPSDDHIYEGVHSWTKLDELEEAKNRKSDISENADHPYWILEKLKRAESDLETNENSALHECIGKDTAEVMLSQENDRDSKYSLNSNHEYWILEKVKRVVSNGERKETLEPTEGGAEKAVAELKDGDSNCTDDEDRPNWTLAGEQEVENKKNKDELYTQTELPTEIFAENQLKLSLQNEAESKN